MGCLFSMGAYYPDSTVLHVLNTCIIQVHVYRIVGKFHQGNISPSAVAKYCGNNFLDILLQMRPKF